MCFKTACVTKNLLFFKLCHTNHTHCRKSQSQFISNRNKVDLENRKFNLKKIGFQVT